MAASTLWSQIDPDTQWKTAPDQGTGYTDLSASTVPAVGAAKTGGLPWGVLNVDHKHFVFGVVLFATGGILYWIYEGKPSGLSAKANVGPVSAGGDLEISGEE